MNAIRWRQGNYIALFDHDDILHPCVLFAYMQAICEKDADYIYCDEATFKGKQHQSYDHAAFQAGFCTG